MNVSPEQWPRLKRLFDHAVTLTGQARDAYLEEACRDDSTIRRHVEALLESHDRDATFLETPAVRLLDDRDDDLSGREAGSYRIESRLGAGGMGEVYRAYDSRLDRPVALKLLSRAVATDPERLRRFRAEARAASSLNHPNIVVIHDFGDLDGRPFIVTELIEGQTLRQRLEAGPLPIRDAIEIATQIAGALAAAHARGIVHRDIKPENVMLRPDGYVKVLDFGLAKLTAAPEQEPSTLTEPGVVMGTPRYMSPEQARGRATDPRSDVWSLGVVLHEMVTGRPPFTGSTTADLISAILNARPAPIDLDVPEAPEELVRIVDSSLQKNCEDRFDSATELHAVLTGLRTGFETGILQPAREPRPQQHTVGREKERADLLNAFRRAAAGQGHLVSVSGEAGSGKTTLVESFLAGLAGTGVRCRIGRGQCSERLAGSEAYLPVLEALESLLRADTTGDIGRRLAEVAPTWHAQVSTATPSSGASARPAESQERLKREIAALVRELSRGEPLLLFFDDVHWADASTIDLLAYLAPRFADLRVLILVTSRPSDLLLANHPFVALRRDLQARRLCHELALDMLTRDDVARYFDLEFPGHAFPAELPRLIHARTEGIPLFMADLVRYLRTSETLTRAAGGQWIFSGSLATIGRDLPESVRSMIERKIAQVSEEDRALLTVASVQGFEFDSAVVAAALPQDAARVEERLEALERTHRFVQLVAEGEMPDRTLTVRYRFVHVLYQNALYAQLRATRKASLSRAVADALVRFHGAQHLDIASELAPLFEAARDYMRASEYYGVAARQAAQLLASREAVVLATRGVSLLQSVEDSDDKYQRELSLRVALANALIATKGYASDEVLQAWTRARELCDRLGDSPHLAAVLYGFASSNLTRGNHPVALRYGAELLALGERQAAAGDEAALLVGHRICGWPLLAMGRLVEARDHFEAVHARYDPARHRALAFSYGHEPGMSARINLAITLCLLGDPDGARRCRDEALAIARQTPHANTQGYALHYAAMHDQLQGDRAGALAHADAAIVLARDQGLALWLAWASIIRGWAVAAGGDLDAGIAQMRGGIADAAALGGALFHTYYLALLAEALQRAGRGDEALSVLDEADALAARSEERFWEAELRRLRH